MQLETEGQVGLFVVKVYDRPHWWGEVALCFYVFSHQPHTSKTIHRFTYKCDQIENWHIGMRPITANV